MLSFLGFGGIMAFSAVGAFLIIERDERGKVAILPALAMLAGGLCIAGYYALATI